MRGILLAASLIVLLVSSMAVYASYNTQDNPGRTVVSGKIFIGPGEHYAILFNSTTRSFKLMKLPGPKISHKAWMAVERAPPWLRWKLIRSFEDLGMADLRVPGNSTVAFGDLDGDGLVDMIVGAADGNLYFYKNVGSSVRPEWMLVKGFLDGIKVDADAAPAVADLDGDGLLDLIVGSRDGTIHFYKNVGSRFKPVWVDRSTVFSGIRVPGNSAPTLFDINGDGLLDLIVGSRDGRIYCYINNGTRSNPRWVRDDIYFQAWIENVGDARGPHYEGVWAGNYSKPAIASLEDGRIYLFVGNDKGEVYIFRNAGTRSHPYWEKIGTVEQVMDPGRAEGIPRFMTPGFWNLTADCTEGYAAPALVDANGDGRLDLFIGSRDGYVYYILNHGSTANPIYPLWKSGAEKMLLATWFWGPAYYPEIERATVVNVTTRYQDYYADLILSVDEKYVDEVAYVVASDRPTNLRILADRNAGNLLVVNARSIYNIAGNVSYVKIEEKGNYTTLLYRTENGWKELPREIYYKYLVMFNRYLILPWHWPDLYHGKFYRTFLPYDKTYNVSLMERVGNAKTLREAAYLVDYWIRVDIGAWWHIGTKYWKPRGWYNIYMHASDPQWAILCGEFSILYEVAARSMDIPTINVVDIAEDHQFNNFWYDGSWHHVDSSSGSKGVNGTWVQYFDPPQGLAGWYKNIGFSYPIEWEEDGMYDMPWRSTLAYSRSLANLYFKVHDEDGRPIDGARVEVWSHWTIESGYDTAPYIAGFNFTNLNGRAALERLGLGRTNNFTVIVTTRIGSTLFGIHLDKPGNYTFDVLIKKHLPPIPTAQLYPYISGVLPMGEGTGSLSAQRGAPSILTFKFKVNWGMQEPPCWIHILYAVLGYKYYYNLSSGVNLDFYVTNPSNYKEYLAGHSFKAYVIEKAVRSGGVYKYPFRGDAFIILSNDRSLTTYLSVSFTASVNYAGGHSNNQHKYYIIPIAGAAMVFTAGFLRRRMYLNS